VFRQEILEQVNLGFDSSASTSAIYSDLPEHQCLKNFKSLSPQELLHRYNCAQIQGLLFRAMEVRLTLAKTSTTSLRSILAKIKFHQLLLEAVDESEDSLVIALSGPLSLFNSSSAYGRQMSNFFPYILQLSSFKLEAKIDLKTSEANLVVDETIGILSHYKTQEGYVPDKVKALADEFMKKYQGFEKLPPAMLNLGGKSYVCPDVSLSKDGKTYHFEIFHRWFEGQYLKRLQVLLEHSEINLYLGVDSSLKRHKEASSLIAANEKLKKRVFFYSDFPSLKQLATILSGE
jgi:predicted nuclease of restriction endonuclease-like RecB superfamily